LPIPSQLVSVKALLHLRYTKVRQQMQSRL
jgi:hypothetical protein